MCLTFSKVEAAGGKAWRVDSTDVFVFLLTSLSTPAKIELSTTQLLPTPLLISPRCKLHFFFVWIMERVWYNSSTTPMAKRELIWGPFLIMLFVCKDLMISKNIFHGCLVTILAIFGQDQTWLNNSTFMHKMSQQTKKKLFLSPWEAHFPFICHV